MLRIFVVIMKKLIILLLLAGAVIPAAAATGGPESLLPTPAQVINGNGTTLYKTPEVIVGSRTFSKATASLPSFAQEEAYRLTISNKGIRIEANTATGAFYAQKSLDQMRRSGDTLACCTVFEGIFINRWHIKSRDITLSTKVHIVKAMAFPVVMYGCESWTVK